MNSETRHALEYHEETKHSQLSLQMSAHYLDFDNKPMAFKIYNGLPVVKLPPDFSSPSLDALEAVGSPKPHDIGKKESDIKDLAQLLFFSAGVTRRLKFDSGTYCMRAASATGALYPIELYVSASGVKGLADGIYHFCPGDFTLTQLHTGDFRQELSQAAQNNDDIASSPATIIFTSFAWRNAWKYQARSYRHWFWDSGVIAANFIATANSAGFETKFLLGFVDSKINSLLLLEEGKEAAIALAPVGIGLAKEPPKKQAFSNYVPDVEKLSAHEVSYPAIWSVHNASSLADENEVASWLGAKYAKRSSDAKNILGEKKAVHGDLTTDSLGDVILRRGSSRRFSKSPISFDSLSRVLQKSSTPVPFDFIKNGESIVDIYFVANAVDGMHPGGYHYNRSKQSLELLVKRTESGSRNEAGFLCLGQSLFSDASGVFFIMADLDGILKAFGNRGYRAAQFEAGIVAGKIYLSAYAQKMGASGSTFYDDSVTEFFSPHAQGKSAMIAVGIGNTAYKARPGKVLAGKISREEILRR